jgi:anti-anti-sigma factor
MTKLADFCFWDQLDETVIVTPPMELGSLDWQESCELTDELLGCLNKKGAKDFVVDLSRTHIMGSQTIGFLIRLRALAVERGGRMALCGVSPVEMETLGAMRLVQGFWHICSKRCTPSPSHCSECPEFVASCLCDE